LPARASRRASSSLASWATTSNRPAAAASVDACVRAGACIRAKDRNWLVIGDAQRASIRCNDGHTDRQNHPINCVDWDQATAYCRVQGKRLRAEEEWGWAAQGGAQARRHPWGDAEPGDQLCWVGPRGLLTWSESDAGVPAVWTCPGQLSGRRRARWHPRPRWRRGGVDVGGLRKLPARRAGEQRRHRCPIPRRVDPDRAGVPHRVHRIPVRVGIEVKPKLADRRATGGLAIGTGSCWGCRSCPGSMCH
jgi:hypothetical protein